MHISVVKQNIYIPFKNVHIEIIQSSAFLNPVTFNQSWQKSFLRKGLSILFKWRTWSTTSSRYHNCNYFYHITLHRKTIFKIILYFSWQKIRRKCYLLPISPANTKRHLIRHLLKIASNRSTFKTKWLYVNRLYTP